MKNDLAEQAQKLAKRRPVSTEHKHAAVIAIAVAIVYAFVTYLIFG